MRTAAKSILALLGILIMLAGGALFLDGLLPLRSHGANPSWLEVVAGLVIGGGGFLLRRFARRALANRSSAS